MHGLPGISFDGLPTEHGSKRELRSVDRASLITILEALTLIPWKAWQVVRRARIPAAGL